VTKLVVGCGYLGRRVARRWLAQGDDVWAVSRIAEHAGALARDGLRLLVADVTRPETLGGLPEATTVLYAVAPDVREAGSPSRGSGVRAVLDALASAPDRFILVSSTGVYGERHAGWVDEETACEPKRDSAKAMWAAETTLREHAWADRAIVLRLAGIYGPGRIPKMADLAAGRALAVASQATVNLIHVDDAVAAVLAAERLARPPALYNVADGEPVDRREFYRAAAELAGWAAPVFVEPAAWAAGRRGGGNKRVSTERIHRELKLHLIYPSYRLGLAAILRGDV
jgi:nucleoside-diphosphate-sugar epimerase